MALTKCPECGTEVSDKADKCPKCAHPVASAILEEKQTTILKLLSHPKIAKKYICTTCGFVGIRERQSDFSGCIFFILLCILILPAIIYAILKSGKYYICPQCENETMIPLTTDNGKKLALEKDPAIFEKIIKNTL